jgi:hypothetical protein
MNVDPSSAEFLLMARMSIRRSLLYGTALLLAFPGVSRTQKAHLDYKVSNIGPVMQVISNHGVFGGGETKYGGSFDNEYPAGSGMTYGPFALWIGGIAAGVKSVAEGGPWVGQGHYGNRVALYPSAETWDTVWVVDRGQTVDIPYRPGYTGVSDQDIVCRYADVNNNITGHTPMFVEVTQVTYAWTSLEFLVHQFWLRPLQGDVRDVYVGICGNAGVGKFPEILGDPNDEFGNYDPLHHLGYEQDRVPDNDATLGPIAWRLVPDGPDASVRWTWLDGAVENWNIQDPPNNDDLRYDHMAAGVFHDPLQDRGYGHFLYAIGPFQLRMGDSVHFTLAQILGKGSSGVYDNLARFLKLKGQQYRTPAPPPLPPLRVATGNHKVTLRWDAQPGDVNPETYTDPNRGDGETQPFEGYRVYKSYKSSSGPWVLLAEFDRHDDTIGRNTGLQRSYEDFGLLNNLQYYYTVTAFSKPDSVLQIDSRESSANSNSVSAIPGTATPATVGQVAVVPNPYRADQKYYDYNPPWESPGIGNTWMEEDRKIQFINLPSPSEIKIFTLSGQYIQTLRHDNPGRGFEDWNLTSHVGQTIASGIYLFAVRDINTGRVQVGKFVIIK